MSTVNEASTCTVRARFYSPASVPVQPTTARWTLRDTTNGRLLQDWTDITVTDVYADITVPAQLNVIQNDRVRYQEHALSVQANVGDTEQYTDEVRYKVKNLSAFK
jgi:hypothetical protein